MTAMLCARCAELEAELAAWRANARDAAKDEARLTLIAALVEQFGLKRGEAAVLAALMTRPGRVLGAAALMAASRCVGQRAADELTDPGKQAQVWVHRLRRVLARRAPDVRIETHIGLGYRLSPADAAVLKTAAAAFSPPQHQKESLP